MLKWTPELVEKCKSQLRLSSSVTEALTRIYNEYGIKLSINALQKGFRRLNVESPSKFLKPIHEDEVEDEQIEFDFDEDETEFDDYDEDLEFNDFKTEENYHFTDTHVLIYTRTKFYKIKKDLFESMHFDYSNMKPGGSLTINQICKKYKIRRADFIRIKNACHWTHDNDPYTDEQHVKSSPNDLANALIQKHRAEFEHLFRKQELIDLKTDASHWRKAKQYFGHDITPENINNKIKSLFSIKSFCDNTKIQTLEPTRRVSKYASSESISLYIPISDLHVGKTYDPFNSKFSKYDKSVLVERMKMVIAYIKEYANTSKNVENVYYSSLGDDFESLFGNMREGQFLSMDAYTKLAFQTVINFHVSVLKQIKESFPDVPVTAVFQGGNHDRLFESKDWGSESLVNWLVTKTIEDEFEDGEIEFLCAPPIASYMLPSGVNVISQHGHIAKIKTDKDVVNYMSIHELEGATRHLIVQAHLHHTLFKSVKNSKFLVNPSVCGSDSYSHNNLAVDAPAEFVMIETTSKDIRLVGPFNLDIS